MADGGTGVRGGGQRARFRLDRRGTTALEFAIIAIPALAMLFMTLGIGIIGMYQQVLDNAVRDVTRQVQINAPAASSAGNFVGALCTQLTVLTSMAGCTAAITYSVQATPLATGFAGLTPAAISSVGVLPNSFFVSGTAYGPNTNLLVQVCWQLPFTIPFSSGLTAAGTGGSCLYGIGAARAEPYNQ